MKTFSGKDVLDTHVQWLASIRETVWGQCNENEKDYLLSFEALKFHWSRACWLCSLWMQADQATVEYLLVDDYGWVIESGVLRIQWDTPENIAHITDVVKQLTSCYGCKNGCKTKRCKCHQARAVEKPKSRNKKLSLNKFNYIRYTKENFSLLVV